MGGPAAPLRHFDEIIATPQLQDRGFLRSWSGAGPPLLGPGLPFKATSARGSGPSFEASLLSGVQPPSPATPGKPLAGLRVLDLGWVWSAPQLGSILAQLGADVIKVEHSKRLDNARMSGSIIRDGQKIDGVTTEMSPMFHQINKGKRGITLNTKLPEGVALARRLAACSDIVLENMSAGTMERTGLGYADLSPLNPALIMVAMSGAGQFGPLADMRTYAPAMSSFAGLEALVGYPGEPPVGALNFAVGDPNAAAHGLVALFAALTRRQSTGTGCYIDLSQTEALLATLTPYMLAAQRDGQQPAPMGNAHPAMAPHGIYRAAGEDRWLSIVVPTDAQWLALAGLVGAVEKHGGRARAFIVQTGESLYYNEAGEPVARALGSTARTPRAKVEGGLKYERGPPTATPPRNCSRSPPPSTPRLCAAPRQWEDVQEGDVLQPILKGPLTITDMICWYSGAGHTYKAHGRADRHRRRHPADAFVNPQTGAQDSAARGHTEEKMAREVGMPGGYDVGPQRISWLGQLVTNWVGDDGFVRALDVKLRRPNIFGDMSWCRGRVADKRIEDGVNLVELEIHVENQLGEKTATGTAVAELPSGSTYA